MDLARSVDVIRDAISKQMAERKAAQDDRASKIPVVMPWGWLLHQYALLLQQYPTGVTLPMIYSEIQLLWEEGWHEIYRLSITGKLRDF